MTLWCLDSGQPSALSMIPERRKPGEPITASPGGLEADPGQHWGEQPGTAWYWGGGKDGVVGGQGAGTEGFSTRQRWLPGEKAAESCQGHLGPLSQYDSAHRLQHVQGEKNKIKGTTKKDEELISEFTKVIKFQSYFHILRTQSWKLKRNPW